MQKNILCILTLASYILSPSITLATSSTSFEEAVVIAVRDDFKKSMCKDDKQCKNVVDENFNKCYMEANSLFDEGSYTKAMEVMIYKSIESEIEQKTFEEEMTDLGLKFSQKLTNCLNKNSEGKLNLKIPEKDKM